MKKILCLIDSLASGGAERQMSYLTTGLHKAGYDVTLVVFSSGFDFYEDYITSRGVGVIYNVKGSNPLKRIFEIIRLVKDLKPDAVIAYKDGVTMAACLARLFKKFKLIVSERNTTQVLDRRESIKFKLYRLADYIVPNSYSQGRFISNKMPALAQKVRVITNTIDLSRFKICNQVDASDDLQVVTLARVMPQKNTLRFLEAIHLLKESGVGNIHFNWYGSRSDKEYVDAVDAKVKELGVGEYITFHDAVNDVGSVLSSADFFCLPSLYEGFANVLCEAMASGLPVVCGDVADNGFIVRDGVNGFLFDPKSAEDIARKIVEMSELGKDRRRSIGRENHEKIINLCSIDAFIDKYKSVIEE